jgi:serine/threonine protein kinase
LIIFIHVDLRSQSDGVTKILNQDGHGKPAWGTDLACHRGFQRRVAGEKECASFGLRGKAECHGSLDDSWRVNERFALNASIDIKDITDGAVLIARRSSIARDCIETGCVGNANKSVSCSRRIGRVILMTLTEGHRLGPYEILAPIGRGGMGEVWKARDTRLNRFVAIKQIKGEHSARFEQEARAIASLNHPHICQIYDIGPDYLVLEYLDGAPLKGPLDVEAARRLAVEIACALEAAHKQGILHRDLKPANVLVTESGVKLLDFGLAKLSANSDETATAAGTVLGTAAYMSPEQAQGKPLDERSEVFSFGAVLYEMLSGRRAFSGGSFFDTLNAVVCEEPAPLESPMAAIVKRCMAKQPSQRFQSMTDLRCVLEQGVAAKPVERIPSIAVLPFADMSAAKDQEYFSDGLAEEIINALTHVPGLKVIARTSSFAFKEQQDIRRIAAALGVTRILEGSVRRAGNRIRVTAQLITASDGSHLWSERFDRDLAGWKLSGKPWKCFQMGLD